jgi:hypothetical protein
MGLKPGDRIERLGPIVITSVRREPLAAMLTNNEYGRTEAALEGFPGWTGQQFVELYLLNAGGSAGQMVTRIEFDYLDAAGRVVPRLLETKPKNPIERAAGLFDLLAQRTNESDAEIRAGAF